MVAGGGNCKKCNSTISQQHQQSHLVVLSFSDSVGCPVFASCSLQVGCNLPAFASLPGCALLDRVIAGPLHFSGNGGCNRLIGPASSSRVIASVSARRWKAVRRLRIVTVSQPSASRRGRQEPACLSPVPGSEAGSLIAEDTTPPSFQEHSQQRLPHR